ncbi:MAG TPA: D-alanyl-D-alanine carboxypeptidase [Candidatus Fournierella merdipullorum]|uniref:serine-type D-Ala-D-Ala carboxypeptidase n=1 Tax=Candidatus Allofournierella merdipullorum TaxID=2838595 RepID=A0A9D2E4T7_9FIRM|nr:D-alanyl-D-alanine carboxypeptidase [Candidatus Fournierella merdipullorum]
MLKKRLLALALCCVLAAALCMPAAAEPLAAGRFALPDFDVPCRAAVLIDLSSGTVLYEKEPDTPMPIASITKVMTLLLTFEAIEAGKVSLQDTVPVSDHAYNMGGSQIWLEPGETFTLDEMIKAICVSSANDAAVAVAEFIGGSEPAFAELMNQKAAQLGMTNTAFKNACGLDEAGHLSTARDVAIMSREVLLNHPRITDYTTIWMDTLRGGQTQLLNTNKLLKRYQGVTGLKTGTTSGAGVCISASASRDGLDLLAVVLGAASSNERFDAATALLDYGFANFENVAAPAPENAPASLPVTGGAQETVELRYAAPEKILVQKGESAALAAELELPQTLAAPLAEGQQVGTVTVYSGETALGSWPVTAASAVQPMTMRLGFERLLAALTAH